MVAEVPVLDDASVQLVPSVDSWILLTAAPDVLAIKSSLIEICILEKPTVLNAGDCRDVAVVPAAPWAELLVI